MARHGERRTPDSVNSDIVPGNHSNAAPGRNTAASRRYGDTPSARSEPRIEWFDSPFEITHYTIALEDDPIYANDPLVQAPGLNEKHREGFLYSNKGVLMQGSGQTSSGEYITIDWSAGGPRGKNTHFTYGLGGASGKPEAWKTVASDPGVVPQGSRLVVDIYRDRGEFLANDTGGAIKGHHLDVFVGGVPIADAYALGTKSSRVGLIKSGSLDPVSPDASGAPVSDAPASEEPAQAAPAPQASGRVSERAPGNPVEFAPNTRAGFTARALAALGRDDKVEDVLLDARYGEVATRAEIAAIAASVLNQAPSGDASPFSDVPGSHWAAGAIVACLESGTMLGVGGDRFLPDQAIEAGHAERVLELMVRGGAQSESSTGSQPTTPRGDGATPDEAGGADTGGSETGSVSSPDTGPSPIGETESPAAAAPGTIGQSAGQVVELFARIVAGQLQGAKSGAHAAAEAFRAANGLTAEDKHPTTDAYGLIWQVASGLASAQAGVASGSVDDALAAAQVAEERAIELQTAGLVPAADAERVIAAARGWQRKAEEKRASAGPGGKPSWITAAEGELGVQEIGGSRHNPRVVEYHSTTGGWKDDETPWCASFVNWCMIKSGYGGNGSAWALDWASYGKRLQRPAYGAIVTFGGGGHVGFVVGKTGNTLQVLGGNQSNQVKISNFSTSRVVAYTVPSGYDVPAAAYNFESGGQVPEGPEDSVT